METHRNTLISFNILSIKQSGQKISKEMEGLNNIMNRVNLMYTYQTPHSDKREYIFLSGVHGTITKAYPHHAMKNIYHD